MTDVFLYTGEANPSDVKLRDPTQISGSVAYALSGDNGTYSYTGQASTFTFARQLAGVNGTYAIAGQNAALSFARNLSGSVGTYSTSGQTASFVFSRLLAGSNGIYAVAGQDAALTYIPGQQTIIVGAGGFADSRKRKKPSWQTLEEKVNRTIEAVYADLRGTAQAKQVAQLVEPFSVSDKPMPPARFIKWDALRRDTETINELLALWQKEFADEQMESDDEFMVMH